MTNAAFSSALCVSVMSVSPAFNGSSYVVADCLEIGDLYASPPPLFVNILPGVDISYRARASPHGAVVALRDARICRLRVSRRMS